MTMFRPMLSRLSTLPGMSRLAAAFRHLKSSRLKPSDVGKSQSNESVLIESLSEQLALPKTFCEFGFDIGEFNCSRLLKPGWRGLLLDGNPQRVRIARRVLARDPAIQVTAECAFLDLENLQPRVRSFVAGSFGVLSIDVDGNDYWFMEALLPMQPALVVVEYNASFGLRSITVPYDARFDRHEKHASGWYHGASLAALSVLAERHGYALIAVSEAGGNAFYCRRERLLDEVVARSATELYREGRLRNEWSKTVASQQWAAIKHLTYVEI